MNLATKTWRLVRAWHHRRSVQAGFALRVTVAAVLSLAIAQYLQLRLPLWAVLTALIVTQVNVGKSLRATVDYLLGTIGGAIYGGAVAVLIPHSGEWALLAVLAIAVAPLAFISSLNPRFSAAPVTAVIVLLVPLITHATPLASAADRVVEVAVGALTGFAVSYLLLPSRAYAQAIELAARTLDDLARALRTLLAGLSQGLDTDALHRIQDGIGHSLVRLNAICVEAEHERSARIAPELALGPLSRTLLRLRHDLVMLGRAAQLPLPATLQQLLGSALEKIQSAATDYLSDCARALRGRHTPPPLDVVDVAFDAFLAELTAIRARNLTRELSADAAERFFALGFALDQLRHNLRDLRRCVSEWSEKPEANIAKRE